MRRWAVGLTVAAAILWVFPPGRYGVYPRCPLYEVFGLLCPGCGATRAAAALLHGHFMEALRWNALFVVTVFAIGLYGLAGRRSGGWTETPSWLVASSVTIAILFAIARNLPLR